MRSRRGVLLTFFLLISIFLEKLLSIFIQLTFFRLTTFSNTPRPPNGGPSPLKRGLYYSFTVSDHHMGGCTLNGVCYFRPQ